MKHVAHNLLPRDHLSRSVGFEPRKPRPRRRTSLAGSHAARVANMSARLAVLKKGVFEGVQPDVPKDAVCKATAKNGGYLTPSDWKSPDAL